MKELSATLLLRPIGFETLATWLYAEASRGTYEEGAVAALMIVLVGLLPVVLLARTGVRSGRERMACARRCWTSLPSRSSILRLVACGWWTLRCQIVRAPCREGVLQYVLNSVVAESLT